MGKAQEESLTERLLIENRYLKDLCWRAAESAKEYRLIGGVYEELREAGVRYVPAKGVFDEVQ